MRLIFSEYSPSDVGPFSNQKCKTTCLTLTKHTLTHWIIVKQVCEKRLCIGPDANLASQAFGNR